ncbi:MAG: hypothetical protein ACO1OC_02605 [Tuberibacillus sp.]
MSNGAQKGVLASLIVLIGFPLIFLAVSLITGEWRYLIFSLPPSFFAGFTCLMLTSKQAKKAGSGK